MAARQVGALPQNFGRGSVQASGAVAAEVNVNPAFLNHRRRCGVTINSIPEGLRVVTVKHLFVKENSSRFRIDTDSKKIMPILRGGSQPNLPAHHDGGGPPAKW